MKAKTVSRIAQIHYRYSSEVSIVLKYNARRDKITYHLSHSVSKSYTKMAVLYTYTDGSGWEDASYTFYLLDTPRRAGLCFTLIYFKTQSVPLNESQAPNTSNTVYTNISPSSPQPSIKSSSRPPNQPS
jgi:hypothetical protein